MKISFEDKSYIELKKEQDKYVVIISGRDSSDRLKKITNSVMLTEQQFQELVREFL